MRVRVLFLLFLFNPVLMTLELANTLGPFFMMAAFVVWIWKYYTAFTYESTFDPKLKGVSFVSGFLLSSFGQKGYKIRYSMPWFWRNKEMEKQFPELAAKGRMIHILAIL